MVDIFDVTVEVDVVDVTVESGVVEVTVEPDVINVTVEVDVVELVVESEMFDVTVDEIGVDVQVDEAVVGVITIEGAPGVDGQDGAPGKDGTNGVDGVDGTNGVDGAPGADGKDGTNGVDGTNGQDGVDGEDGPPGLSAYQLALDAGFVGSQEVWLASLQGQDGQDGLPGADGQDGADGLPGADGTTYTVPAVVLYPRLTSDYGNGLDGRVPAIQLADAALAGGYPVGFNGPWSSVNVYLAWMEGVGTSAGNVRLAVYLQSLTENVRPIAPTINGATGANYAAAGSQYRYHETLIRSGLAVTPNAFMYGCVARYGADAADTYASHIGIIGLILRPA